MAAQSLYTRCTSAGPAALQIPAPVCALSKAETKLCYTEAQFIVIMHTHFCMFNLVSHTYTHANIFSNKPTTIRTHPIMPCARKYMFNLLSVRIERAFGGAEAEILSGCCSLYLVCRRDSRCSANKWVSNIRDKPINNTSYAKHARKYIQIHI